MIVLVCGGRDFRRFDLFLSAVNLLPEPPELMIHGGAAGADRMTERYGRMSGVHWASVPALWNNNGKAAGGIRNGAMLLLKPDYCLAMPGSTGTQDMVDKCRVANVPVWRPFG